MVSYPSAFVKTHIYDAFEENEIGFWEFKGLELGSKQISIFGQEVLKQHWIHSASEINKILIRRNVLVTKVLNSEFTIDIFR